MKEINLIRKYFFYNLISISFILIFSSLAYAKEKNLISDIYPFNEDGTINVVVEIPAGTLEKWEVSKDGSQIVQQIENNKIRTINYLAYPFNYGFIPQTFLPVEEGGDGDQLDIIIIGPNIERGSILKVKPIGTIIVMDNNEIDPNLEKLYISSIRKSIQTYAINNYPNRSLRNNEEGTVDIIFKLKLDGNIENITIGPKTLASKRLIDAAIKAVKQNAPYENEEILKQKNEFSILIIYKID